MRLIESMRELESLAGRLGRERLVAADTEAAGYHRYADRLCLLQLSTRDETWLVDTLAVGSLNPLADVFEDPAIETIFHDADYDLRLLDRDFDVHVGGLFDTKIAARFAGERAFGLSSLLDGKLGVRLEKKFQRADWAKRPLSPEMLEYAAMDTRYLPELRDRLKDRLEEMGRLAWAEEEFRISERTAWEPSADDEAVYMKLKGARDLDRRGLAALRELHAWREELARERDVASFRVLNNEPLLEMATRLPASERELAAVPGLSDGNVRRYGRALLEALDRARAVPESELPSWPRGPRRPPRDPDVDAWVERLRQARDAAADRLDLERGFLMPRAQLEELARRQPADRRALAEVPGVRNWQVEAIGDALLDVLSGNGRNSN
ncbi:MAG TPA: ribonuclease D [Longimicrobiales bacterium]|nr:ribonuclease D [Longimicrobiales bacterium]